MSYFANLKQEVVVLTDNCSTANLAADAWFVGIAESTLSGTGIQFGLKTTQNCTLYIDQADEKAAGVGTVTTNGTTTLVGSGTEFLSYHIGDQIYVDTETVRIIDTITNDEELTVTEAFSTSTETLTFEVFYWDLHDEVNYKTTKNCGDTVYAIKSYVRFRVHNESTSLATTHFRLSGILVPIANSVPRALSEEGNFKVGVYEIENDWGDKVRISPNGGLDTYQAEKLVGVPFNGTTVDTTFWTTTATNNGSAVQTGGEIYLRTITAPATSSPNGTASITSTRVGRYINGIPNMCRMQCDFDGHNANNTKRIGVFTGTIGSPTDGAVFEIIDQVFSIATYKAGTPTRVANGSFNGDYGATCNDIPANLETFEIIYNNRYVWFMWNNKLVHKVDSSATGTWSDTLHLPCRAECYNTGNSTTDTGLKIRSFVIMRLGSTLSRATYKYFTGAVAVAAGLCKRGPGTLHALINNDSAGSIIIYDSIGTASTIIASIDLTKIVSPIIFNVDFQTGLSIALTGIGAKVTITFD